MNKKLVLIILLHITYIWKCSSLPLYNYTNISQAYEYCAGVVIPHIFLIATQYVENHFEPQGSINT